MKLREVFANLIIKEIAQMNRLEKLSTKELIEECLENKSFGAADNLIVQEMMNRLYPDWDKDKEQGDE